MAGVAAAGAAVTTEYATLVDAVDPEYRLDVGTGTGGVRLWIYHARTEKGMKFWLRSEDYADLFDALRVSMGSRAP